jgi:hypothetical protein
LKSFNIHFVKTNVIWKSKQNKSNKNEKDLKKQGVEIWSSSSDWFCNIRISLAIIRRMVINGDF